MWPKTLSECGSECGGTANGASARWIGVRRFGLWGSNCGAGRSAADWSARDVLAMSFTPSLHTDCSRRFITPSLHAVASRRCFSLSLFSSSRLLHWLSTPCISPRRLSTPLLSTPSLHNTRWRFPPSLRAISSHNLSALSPCAFSLHLFSVPISVLCLASALSLHAFSFTPSLCAVSLCAVPFPPFLSAVSSCNSFPPFLHTISSHPFFSRHSPSSRYLLTPSLPAIHCRFPPFLHTISSYHLFSSHLFIPFLHVISPSPHFTSSPHAVFS